MSAAESSASAFSVLSAVGVAGYGGGFAEASTMFSWDWKYEALVAISVEMVLSRSDPAKVTAWGDVHVQQRQVKASLLRRLLQCSF